MSDMSVQAYDNAMTYYEEETARNIAITGANMAANYIFLYPPLINGNAWFNGYTTPVSFGGGTFVVTVDSTTSIDPLTGDKRLTLRSTATYRDSTSTVMVILRPSNFAKFALYAGTSASAVYWATYDSIFGPCHVEGNAEDDTGIRTSGGRSHARTTWTAHRGAGIRSSMPGSRPA